MAGANLSTHIPIIAVKTDSGNTPENQAVPELNGQTFAFGVPVQLAGGFLKLWDGATYNAGLLGVASENAHNLATSGVGLPLPFGQITGNMAINTFGSVPNQPNAVNIPFGSPIVDGRCLCYLSSSDIIFEAQYDNSAGTVAANWTTALTLVGSFFGLTADGNGYYYVDGGKTTVGTNTCVQVVELNPVDGPTLNGRVRFKFAKAAQQTQG